MSASSPNTLRARFQKLIEEGVSGCAATFRLKLSPATGSWVTQTFIAGLSADAIIVPRVIRGAMDGPAFASCIEKVPVPEPEPGTKVMPDDLATHKHAGAANAMRQAGCWFLFLPPYSPDLNPIGVVFSKLMAALRRIGTRLLCRHGRCQCRNLRS